MRLKSLFLLFGLTLCILSLVNCSRESSIKENVNLRNNHSVVFVYKTPFENPEAFADSIINLPNPDSVIVSDTITVTIGDTIHMMGFLRYNSDKIYLYQWILDSLVKDSTGKGKDKMKKALVTGRNATPQSWVYLKEGIYSPLFVAVDGNSATDTAGKDQFIRVINTPPYLGVPRDTLWTRAKSPITFPVLALDSFGTITSFKVDVDAKGKREAKEWKYTQSEDSDSVLITIPYDSTLTDTLGNQTIYIILTDDDGNTTKDSVHLHFNQLPTIKILGPDDQQRISDTVESFRLFYEGHDRDNEDQLRYYVRVAATPDNQDADLNLSNVYDLVLKNSTSTSFAVIENGVNALKNLGYTGRYFSWDVWVTDGYDTVVAEKIKTGKGKQRPRYFYLGPSKSTCDFIGSAKFEGLSVHSGIKITLVNVADTNNIYTAETKPNGEFRVSGLPSGTFRLTASDETGRGFVKVTTRTPNINAGDEKVLPPILLKDPAPPRILNIKGVEDTMTVRSFTITGRFSDYGSQVKKAVALLGKDTCSTKNNSCGEITISKSFAWSINLANLADGKYSFKLTATDSAGLHSDTTISFVVAATNMTITVNGANAAMVGTSGELVFAATIKQAKPRVNRVYWISDAKGKKDSSDVDDEGNTSIKLYKADFPDAELGKRYTMHAVADNGSGSNNVRFGFYENGPVVTIENPAYDTTITINDVITVHTNAFANNQNQTDLDFATFEWTCLQNGTAGGPCLTGSTADQTISWTTAGTKLIAVHVVNKQGEQAFDTLKVNVVKDPPTISIDENEEVITQKVSAHYMFGYTAKDRLGTIASIGWRCGDKNGAFTPAATTIPPETKQLDDSVTVDLPSTEKTNYKCFVKVTDDDNQVGYDSIRFNIIKDIPTIRLNIQETDVTIKDREQVKFTTSNILGGPIDLDLACDLDLKNLKPATWSSKWQGSRNSQAPYVTMPTVDKDKPYYCVMKAADAEEPTLYSLDTTTYIVHRATPTVTVNESYTMTIKDTITLYANAKDSAEADLPGRIISYEWGCGPNSDNGLLGKLTSTGKNTYKVTLPDTPQNDYLCIVQVMDDDSLTARDTTHFVVELAPPTVKVARDTAIVREGFAIILSATAHDAHEGTMGYIAKREWSCGRNTTDINSNWKKVSSFDTTWTTPPQAGDMICIARATDDDGNIASDTMYLVYSTEIPIISVDESQKFVAKGDPFLLDADTNSVWQGIDWYSWRCFKKSNKQPVEDEKRLTYKGRFYTYREELSKLGVDLYCVVSAQESATQMVFTDTTFVTVMTQENLPIAKITAADTIYPWSGDESLSGEAVYYYTPEWGGTQSEIGSLGNENLKEFYWQFSNIGGTFYQGRNDGTLDTTSGQFHAAFKRPTTEDPISVCLDFRDSTLAGADQTFMNRHRAALVCRTIYVQRAWKNLAGVGDTVLEQSTVRTPPAIATVGNLLTVAYMTSGTTITSKYYDGSQWFNLGNITVADSVIAMRMVSNNSIAYLAVLTKANKLYVYKSTGGTSVWNAVGQAINGATSVNLTYNTDNNNPVVTYAKANYPYFSYWSGTKWEEKQIDSTITAREVNGIFTSKKLFLITFTDNTYLYNTYYAVYSFSYSRHVSPRKIDREMGSISLASQENTIYMGYINRSSVVGKAGPYVKIGEVSQTGLSWGQNSEKNLQEAMFPSNIRVASFNGKIYAIIDDNGRGFSHCHAFFYDGISWKPYGENQLPYFKGEFYNRNHYNLFGFAPEIAVSTDGMVYISMISWAGLPKKVDYGSGPVYMVPESENNGPIFMKNISERWTINTKP